MHARNLLGLLGGAAQRPPDTGSEIVGLALCMPTLHGSSFYLLPMVADWAAKPAGYTWSSLMDAGAGINPAMHEFDRLAVDVN
jgi:hypothetical protein